MKFKLQKWCIRFSSVFAVLAVLVLVTVPALAAPIDYNDYVTDIRVDGNNDIVTVTIPADMAQVFIYDMDGNEVYRGVGSVHDFVFGEDESYSLQVWPFGYPFTNDTGFELLHIPNGTKITSGFGYVLDATPTEYLFPDVYVRYFFVPTDNYDGFVLDDIADYTAISHTYTVDAPEDATILNVGYEVWYVSPKDIPVASVYIQDTKMVFTISSLLRQQQATGKTNAILKEVEKQLAEQGKTLDDIKQQQQDTNDKLDGIINGDVKPESPDGSDRFDDLEDLESGLLDDSQSGMEQGEQITQNALEVVLQYATAFACAGWIFERFTSIPIFTALLTVSLALGLYAFIVNLAQDISSASARAERKLHRKEMEIKRYNKRLDSYYRRKK